MQTHKVQINAGDQVTNGFGFFLMALEDGMSFLDAPQGKIKKSKGILVYFWHFSSLANQSMHYQNYVYS